MKTDRRTKYTKMVIREALLSLLHNRPIEKITVSDLCARAEISRPTFYLHYADLYALLDEIGEDMITSAKLEEMMRLPFEDQDAIYHAIVNLLTVVEENLDLYRACVLERSANSRLPAKIAEALEKTVTGKWERDGDLDEKLDRHYITEYIQASFNAIVSCWAYKKENRESLGDLAKLIERFLVYGLCGFVKNCSRPGMPLPDV